MMNKQFIKIAIFIDYQNFLNSFRKHHNIERIELEFWENFHVNILEVLVNEGFIMKETELPRIIGTWIVHGVSQFPDRGEKSFLRFLDRIDKIHGKIVKMPNDKGVETEITCQMLFGAFFKRFDIALLLSENEGFIPVVQKLQDYFGVHVIQLSFDEKSQLRPRCYGHIPLEKFNQKLKKS